MVVRADAVLPAPSRGRQPRVLLLFALVAIFAKQIAPYGYDEIDLDNPDPSTGLAMSPRSRAGTSSAPTSSGATT